MIFVIDANSLLALVRYHVCFDSDNILRKKVESLFGEGNIVLLDTIKEECRFAAEGIAAQELPFLVDVDAEKHIEIESREIHTRIDTIWRARSIKKRRDYEERKSRELRRGDFQLIFYALENSGVTIVTEESPSANDRKLFKKIPLICKAEGIDCITLPEMLENLELMASYRWR